jgi:HTH-type transcriptional regulator/antitoxin HigA
VPQGGDSAGQEDVINKPPASFGRWGGRLGIPTAKDVMKSKLPKSTKKPKRPAASESYLALAAAYPIHPIRSETDLDDAIAVVDSLLSRPEPLDDQEQDYLESLSNEVERYEAVAYPMPALSEAGLMRELMVARDATLSDVAAETGIAISTLSAILSGKRKFNLTHIRGLATYFGVDPGVFLNP